MSRGEIPLSLLFLWIVQAIAQSSNVTQCISQYDWSINSRNQTPCLVAAYLENVCKPTQVVQVNAIPVNNHYFGPTFAQADICSCNVVVYSLISACGGCQGRTFTNWEKWILNCVVSDKETFPMAVPTTIEVPNWAYLNINLTNDTFDPVTAEAVTRASQVSSTPLASQSVTSTAAGSPTTPTAPPSPTSSSLSHAGAIAGGVVGGIAFIAAVLLCAFWFFMRHDGGRKKRQRPHEKINLNEGDSQPSALVDATMNHIVAHSMSSVPTGPAVSRNDIGLRDSQRALSPAASAMYTTFGGRNSFDSIPYAGSQMTRGAYSYAAEI